LARGGGKEYRSEGGIAGGQIADNPFLRDTFRLEGGKRRGGETNLKITAQNKDSPAAENIEKSS